MPGAARPALRGRELLVDDPLQPAEEVDPVGELRARCAATAGRARVLQRRRATASRLGPCTSASAHQVAKSTQPAALALAERARSRPAGRGCAARCAPASAPTRLASHTASRSSSTSARVARAQLRSAIALDLGARRAAEVAELRHVLDPEVERAHEAPGHRQVRRRLDRHGRGRRVQRVDQHEAGARARRRSSAPARQVVEVAGPQDRRDRTE